MNQEVSKEQGIQEMKELLEVMSRALVDEPDKVNVTPVDTGDRIVLELRVADDDMGRVIGRGGRRAQAMRSIIKAKATRCGLRSAVDIIDREEDEAAKAAAKAKEEAKNDSYEESDDSYDDYDEADDADYEYEDDEDYDYEDEDDDDYDYDEDDYEYEDDYA